MLRIGIDTGGTFTDFVVFDGDRVSAFKLPSTPDQPEKAVLDGLSRIVGERTDFLLQHGSTVATNALLERKGARTLLITNEGFEDILEIGRQNRPGLYSLEASRPEPLVSRKFRVGVRERTLWDGSQLVRLEEKSLSWLKNKVTQLKPESIAVVLLYSYLAPENERRIEAALQDEPIPVSLSHRILPEFREFERTSTTVVNAYVRPIMARYLSALRGDETVRRGSFTIMQSNGGSIASETAELEPVRTLFSGPAGGVVGAFDVARRAGIDKIITLDMGGTSTDVCLCDGRIETSHESTIDHQPVAVQMIGIQTVGAGGGSIAWVDDGGLLRVGPRSAGAEPGPVALGKGEEPTVTDAHLYLSRMEPDYYLGGKIKLAPERIQPALERLGDELSRAGGGTWEPIEIAEGIIRIANAQIERALRVISLQKGHDTRDFTLVSFGGAGGLHACKLAEQMMIPRVLVPLNPGTLSAQGILQSDVIQDASRTVLGSSRDAELESRVREAFEALEESVGREMSQQGFTADQVELNRSVDVRYSGQSYEINTPYSEAYAAAFHSLHEKLYGYCNEKLPVEVVNVRVRGRAVYPQQEWVKRPLEGEEPQLGAMIQEKQVILGGQPQPVRFYLRSQLRAGNRIPGPAIVLEYGGTTYLPVGFHARVDEWLNLALMPSVA